MGQAVQVVSSWAAWPIDSLRFSEMFLTLCISRRKEQINKMHKLILD